MAKQRTAARERARAERKRAIAAQQAEGYEDVLSQHELNLDRLDAIPAAQRGEDFDQRRQAEVDAIAEYDRIIEATLAAAKAPAGS